MSLRRARIRAVPNLPARRKVDQVKIEDCSQKTKTDFESEVCDDLSQIESNENVSQTQLSKTDQTQTQLLSEADQTQTQLLSETDQTQSQESTQNISELQSQESKAETEQNVLHNENETDGAKDSNVSLKSNVPRRRRITKPVLLNKRLSQIQKPNVIQNNSEITSSKTNTNSDAVIDVPLEKSEVTISSNTAVTDSLNTTITNTPDDFSIECLTQLSNTQVNSISNISSSPSIQVANNQVKTPNPLNSTTDNDGSLLPLDQSQINSTLLTPTQCRNSNVTSDLSDCSTTILTPGTFTQVNEKQLNHKVNNNLDIVPLNKSQQEKDDSLIFNPPSSPSKNRHRIKPTPRLNQRRNSVHGSTSESEDEVRNNMQNRNRLLQTPDSRNSLIQNIRNGRGTLRKKPQRRSEVGQKLAEARKSFIGKYGSTTPDRSQLTVFDMIYYNPSSNPMKRDENKLDEEKVEDLQELIENDVAQEENVDDPDKLEEPAASLPVPQIKIGPSGEIILDEQSLVIETTGTQKGRDDIANSNLVYDDGNSNYGIYKKRQRPKDWTAIETLRFYKALSTIGTDFSLMVSFFPGRSRRDLKLKFKKEEKVNMPLVNKVLCNPQDFDTIKLEEELNKEELNPKKSPKVKKERKRKILKHKVNKENDEGKSKRKKSKFVNVVNFNSDDEEIENGNEKVCSSEPSTKTEMITHVVDENSDERNNISVENNSSQSDGDISNITSTPKPSTKRNNLDNDTDEQISCKKMRMNDEFITCDIVTVNNNNIGNQKISINDEYVEVNNAEIVTSNHKTLNNSTESVISDIIELDNLTVNESMLNISDLNVDSSKELTTGATDISVQNLPENEQLSKDNQTLEFIGSGNPQCILPDLRCDGIITLPFNDSKTQNETMEMYEITCENLSGCDNSFQLDDTVKLVETPVNNFVVLDMTQSTAENSVLQLTPPIFTSTPCVVNKLSQQNSIVTEEESIFEENTIQEQVSQQSQCSVVEKNSDFSLTQSSIVSSESGFSSQKHDDNGNTFNSKDIALGQEYHNVVLNQTTEIDMNSNASKPEKLLDQELDNIDTQPSTDVSEPNNETNEICTDNISPFENSQLNQTVIQNNTSETPMERKCIDHDSNTQESNDATDKNATDNNETDKNATDKNAEFDMLSDVDSKTIYDFPELSDDTVEPGSLVIKTDLSSEDPAMTCFVVFRKCVVNGSAFMEKINLSAEHLKIVMDNMNVLAK